MTTVVIVNTGDFPEAVNVNGKRVEDEDLVKIYANSVRSGECPICLCDTGEGDICPNCGVDLLLFEDTYKNYQKIYAAWRTYMDNTEAK
jgi:hypothetical protein